ncbi:flagellar biosynthetic protein FliO [Saccharospirillum mangrovi]|uniref:flagellar biosynthetic protein FliO n=1 Tax=Saccharospirillum mangrovi TaxID=2161747 RepID=UPI000D36CE05|nr:flagellar biosynthetic protein FliO [Saccharospirillum mangrovi]
MGFDTHTKNLTRALLTVGLLSVAAMPAWAQQPGPGPLSGGGSDYFKLTLTLIFIVGLIFACGWLVRRMAGGTSFNNRHIKVLSVMPLGTREKLMVVKAFDDYLLLGVTTNNINTLHRFDEPPDLTETPLTSPFADRMKGLLKGLDSDPLAKHQKNAKNRSNSGD